MYYFNVPPIIVHNIAHFAADEDSRPTGRVARSLGLRLRKPRRPSSTAALKRAQSLALRLWEARTALDREVNERIHI